MHSKEVPALKTLKVFPNRAEAEMFASILEQNGFESTILVDDSAGLKPSMVIVNGVKLVVSDEDYTEAREFLDSMKIQPD